MLARTALAFAPVVVLCATAVAAPSVMLTGEETVVVEVGALLEQRGITSDMHGKTVARVERKGEDLVVTIANDSRIVRSAATAAAVIESFVRDDVGSPLLESRPVPARAALRLDDAPFIKGVERDRSGWHFTAAVETSFDNDGTNWGGMQLGACVMLGPFCPGLRLRGTVVAEDDPKWAGMWRKSSEALLGVDLPISVGRYLLMPGVAAGWGGVTTKRMSDNATIPSRSDNFRAQLHVAFAIPLSRSWAIDLYAAGTLVQQVERAPGYMDEIPGEPLALFRFGVGVRYGRR